MNDDEPLPLPDRGPNPLNPDLTQKKEPTAPPKEPPYEPYGALVISLGVLFIVLGIVLAVWTLFYAIVPETPPGQITYGVYQFARDKTGSWRFDWQSGNVIYSVPLRYNPLEVKEVILQGRLNESFNRPTVYITFDPTQGNFSTQALAAGELSLNMVRALGVTPVAACTKNETNACISRPILNCGEPNSSVILLKDEGESKIWLKEDCIVLFGKDLDLLRSVDRLLYQWYEVMK